MTGFFTLDGPSFGPASGGRPRALVVLLHGLGADGHDLIELAPHWSARLPDALFISPHAPFPCDMAPYGRQWFSLQDRDPERVRAGVAAAAPILDAFLDTTLEAHALTDAALALVGFSQGTMMSLFVAPRRARALAGVVGFSGALVGAEALTAETRAHPPILLVHGDADPVVPFAAMTAAARALEAAGLPVVTERRPGLAHGIDPTGMDRAGAFLAKHLPR
jgi:phospholipase/carboxylesterase